MQSLICNTTEPSLSKEFTKITNIGQKMIQISMNNIKKIKNASTESQNMVKKPHKTWHFPLHIEQFSHKTQYHLIFGVSQYMVMQYINIKDSRTPKVYSKFSRKFYQCVISEARTNYPSLKAGRKLNVHHPRRLLNILFTFNLRPVFKGLPSSVKCFT